MGPPASHRLLGDSDRRIPSLSATLARHKSAMAETRPPLPPFSLETAKAKVQAAQDAWNSRLGPRLVQAEAEP